LSRRRCIVAIDQGTSSTRAVVYDEKLAELAAAQREFRQYYPQSGWVEHDAEEIWSTVLAVLGETIAGAGITAADVASIGITNQRETTIVWDRATGEPIANAIVWQDRRTADTCERLQNEGAGAMVTARTGLRLDPYFSATKLAWLLDNVDGARSRARRGELAFGTVDCFLLWRLTGGRAHATDATNASRTLLFDLHRQDWDPDLLELFDIPAGLLPTVRDCVATFGVVADGLPCAGVPIGGIAGDQQAALIGQAGVGEGMIKTTFGTGCFVIANTGPKPLASRNQLLTTVARRLDGEVVYGLEGSVFVAGSALQWLRDALRIIDAAPDSEAIARKTGVVDDVVVVPAFAGLGAPWWDPHARGAILGLTRGSDRERIVTATLQAIAYQTADLVRAMADDGIRPAVIRVDGGMVKNDWFLQFLADILRVTVERPRNTESTVFGAACLAALHAGLLDGIEAVGRCWQSERRFEPRMPDDQRTALLAGWADAVSRVRGAR
jgi:glycerol kinase